MTVLLSADVALLFKISELAKLYGLRPSEANATIRFDTEVRGGVEHPYHELSFEETTTPTLDKFLKLAAALGLDDHDALKTDNFSEIEDAVDRALSLAPRARTR